MLKVLVSDNLSKQGVKLLEETPDIDVDVNTGLTPDELRGIIGQYHGLIIRSATKVTADIIEAANNLRVIGRAGIGLDNVDVAAASRKGIVVMNAPEGNTITTAEHTIALMLALSRKIPQATQSMKEGKWEKKKFMGRELYGKTLGIIGAGNIGRIVADRAKGLKMKVIVYDPYIRPEILEKMDLEPVSFDELLERSDYITIHTPKTSETINMINKDTIQRMKKGAMLINCARGGIVNEDDLYDALASGHLAGAALDVFSKEPPEQHKLFTLDNFISTPHLGASTEEAQDKVAVDIVKQVIDYLLHGTVKNAVNVPSISPELINVIRPYVTLMERIGLFHAQLAESALLEVEIRYLGTVADYDVSPLTTAFLKGLLTPFMKEDVNFVNAPFVAKDRGIKVTEGKSSTSEDFANLIMVKVKSLQSENVISGTIFGKGLPRILRINDFYLEAAPEGHMLFIHNQDIPGVIGQIGVTLGKYNININRMSVGQEKEGKKNIILLATDISVPDNVIEELRKINGVFMVKKIEL